LHTSYSSPAILQTSDLCGATHTHTHAQRKHAHVHQLRQCPCCSKPPGYSTLSCVRRHTHTINTLLIISIAYAMHATPRRCLLLESAGCPDLLRVSPQRICIDMTCFERAERQPRDPQPTGQTKRPATHCPPTAPVAPIRWLFSNLSRAFFHQERASAHTTCR
jgi:hypothetical protein